MNSTYSILGNSKVLVTSENGRQKIVDNYDNINEILIEENIIESVAKKVDELEDKKKKYEKINKRKYVPIMIIVSFFLTKIILPLIFNSYQFIFYDNLFKFDLVNIIVFSLATCTDTFLFILHKQNIKKQKGINSELYYLRECLKKENKKMRNLIRKSNSLKASKQVNNITVRSADVIDNLNKHSAFYYNIGYNSEKYYNYYMKGNINGITKKHYTEEDSDLVKDYFEQNGPTLVKRKVRR